MATTAEMLSDPAYIRQLKAIADQNAWNSMLKTGSEIANQNPWTGLGQLLGTAIGLKWGRNEGEADYQRSINAFREKKFQDAFNKNSSWINNATSAVSQLSQPQTPTNSQPVNPLWFNQNKIQENFSQGVNYTPPPNYDFNLNLKNYKYNPQNNGVNTWQNKILQKYSLPPTLNDFYLNKSTQVNNVGANGG